ncbi:methyl-accepting chemotaxis protein [Vibrio sp. SCSIO 43169]|uniref:methyl-accepting chemotaxis protein n=1 Tax=Vibrio sp. SCSIO 43169 TaxID=2822801 RepID=UPI002043C5EC|nr:methyl-accepting chemotaxis protein [Vibrio sp. SCSIO 43169]MCM5511068.1 methyl-accepting chemotaxis protein [Vibrio sp. SCSIO 43169]
MGLHQRLSMVLSGVFLVIVSAISSWGYFSFKAESTKNYQTLLEKESVLIGHALEQRLERNFDVLMTMSSVVPISDKGILELDSLLGQLNSIVKHNEVINAYVALSDGSTYSTSTNGLVANFNAKEKQREWFVRVFSGEPRVVTAPYQSAEGDAVMAVAVPVSRKGNIVAVLVTNIKVNTLTSFVSTLAPDNQVWVARKDGYLMAAKFPGLLGKNLYEVRPSYAEFRDQVSSAHFYQVDGVDYFVASQKLANSGWTVWGWEHWADIVDASKSNLFTTLAMSFVLIISALLVLYYCLKRFVYEPLGGEPEDITKLMNQVASGQLTVEAPTGSEKGIYASAIVMASKLKRMLLEVKEVSQQVGGISGEVDTTASNVSLNANEQMRNLEQTATAMNEMVSTVDEVARSAGNASNAAQQAYKNANEGVDLVLDVDRGIDTLTRGIVLAQEAILAVNNESQSVGQIVDVIDDIAEQTNLLALNAAIEAARAGEQGRGFAVVADEVRNLASRTQTSTAKIQQLIGKLQEEAARSVEVMQKNEKESKDILAFSKQATSALETIQASVSEIQDMNTQIVTAAEEQSIVASQINESVSDLNELAGKTHEGSSKNRALANQLKVNSECLEEQVDQFKF